MKLLRCLLFISLLGPAIGCGKQELTMDFSTPRSTLRSLFTAESGKDAEKLITCFTDEYYASFGMSKEQMIERLNATFEKVKSGIRFSEIEITNELKRPGQVRMEYRVTEKSKAGMAWGEKLAYLLRETPEGWKVYGADSFDGTHWLLTLEDDPFTMRPLEELLHPDGHEHAHEHAHEPDDHSSE